MDNKLIDDFETDLLAVTIESRQGPITIATDYIPLNSPILHYINYLSLHNRDEPVYILGDVNVAHRIFGHNDYNPVQRNMKTLIAIDKCRHEGPDFPTY